MSVKKEVFVWKKHHKLALLREILVVEPYRHKIGSKERGTAWSTIAENLNLTDQTFRVNARSVREKFAKLLDDWKKTEQDEVAASGVEGKEVDEYETALMDIYTRIEEIKAGWARDSLKEDEEKRKAAEIRLKATERLGETSRRERESDLSDDEEESSSRSRPMKKRRASNADVCQVLSQSIKMKLEQRKEEKEQEQQAHLKLVQHQNSFFSQQQGMFMQFMQQQMDMQREQQRIQNQMQEQLLKLISGNKDHN